MSSAVLLINPKYPHNVAAVIRACAAYGIEDLLYTGNRMDAHLEELGRMPREERLKGYKTVHWRRSTDPFREMKGRVPIAIEVMRNSEMLNQIAHPDDALYVFGPEDGSLGGPTLRHCHRFVAIPTRHCLNLSMSVGTVLYDRQAKLAPDFRMDMAMTESRGFQVASE